MKREGILLAVRAEVAEQITKVLKGTGLPLIFAHTLPEACRELEKRTFQLVLGTLQFDESRLFDLLPATRASSTPLVAVRLTESQLPDNVIDAFFRAVQLSGFHGWLDYYRVSQQQGEAEAHRRLYTLIKDLALPAAA